MSPMQSLLRKKCFAKQIEISEMVITESVCPSDLNSAKKELESQEFTDVYAVFSTVGRTMIRVMGGASGIIFGLLFYAGSKNMAPKSELTTKEFSEIFSKALIEIQNKGQAKLGDKTLVDGLQPMVEAMQGSADRGDGFKALLEKAYLAAEAGKESSKQYVARIGKAKTSGRPGDWLPRCRMCDTHNNLPVDE